ncbi:hypothetical protein BC829DRAFT_407425, partial [Chytridium lagenaria]
MSVATSQPLNYRDLFLCLLPTSDGQAPALMIDDMRIPTDAKLVSVWIALETARVKSAETVNPRFTLGGFEIKGSEMMEAARSFLGEVDLNWLAPSTPTVEEVPLRTPPNHAVKKPEPKPKTIRKPRSRQSRKSREGLKQTSSKESATISKQIPNLALDPRLMPIVAPSSEHVFAAPYIRDEPHITQETSFEGMPHTVYRDPKEPPQIYVLHVHNSTPRLDQVTSLKRKSDDLTEQDGETHMDAKDRPIAKRRFVLMPGPEMSRPRTEFFFNDSIPPVAFPFPDVPSMMKATTFKDSRFPRQLFKPV